MGSRFTVVLFVLGVASSAACGGKSQHHDDDGGGSGGEDQAGNGNSNGGTTSLGGSTSSGGNTARGGTGTTTGGTGAARGGTGATTGGTSSVAGGTTSVGGTMALGGTTSTGAMGGSGNASGGTSPECDSGRFVLVPDATGWMDVNVPCNFAEVQGNWFSYGDQYGSATCLDPGQHLPEECAVVTAPDPNASIFPNMNGFMHTTGIVGRILPCAAGVTSSGCPAYDYANMWGAGIGFDFNADSPDDEGARYVWDANDHDVLAIEFTIDAIPLSGLRVEFPIVLTDEEAAAASPPLPPGSSADAHTAGAPYWGAQRAGDSRYPNSPVMPGVNRISLTGGDVASPVSAAYTFDRKRLLGMRFHVVANSTSSSPYEFTISNVTLTRDTHVK